MSWRKRWWSERRQIGSVTAVAAQGEAARAAVAKEVMAMEEETTEMETAEVRPEGA